MSCKNRDLQGCTLPLIADVWLKSVWCSWLWKEN